MEFESQANILYEMMNTENVDGILIASNVIGQYISEEELEEFSQRYQPVPMVNMGIALKSVPSVVLDNYAGTSAVVRHLLEEHQYRRIAFVGGLREHPEAQERYRAFAATLQEHGIPLDPALVTFGDFQFASGVGAIQHWLDERQFRPRHDIEAIVVSNDYMAMGVISELQARSFQVPADIAVVGFDDTPWSSLLLPPLTVVSENTYTMGEEATKILLGRIEKKERSIPKNIVLEDELIIREST